MKINILSTNLFIFLLFLMLFSTSAFGQTKEYDRLKDIVDRGKLDKAEEYCNKVTKPYDPKTAGRFYGLVGIAYYNKKDYPKAAEMILKSQDKKTAQKLAKEYENKDNSFYDIKIAGRLYRIANDYEKAAELLFQEGIYEEAAEICPSPASNLKFGKLLFNQNKMTEALYFLKKAKVKGQKFTDDTVLNYFYKLKDYKTVYSIQNSDEGNYSAGIQGCVIDKMYEYNEPLPFITHFLDSINVKGNKQMEALISGMINNNMYDKTENYCMEQNQSNKQLALTYLADITSEKHPAMSAWANLKLGKAYISKQQAIAYLVKIAVEYNGKWEKEPISKKTLDAYNKETKPWIEKCSLNYCEIAKLAESKAKTNSDELAKANPNKGDENARANLFLKSEIQAYCK